MNVLRATLIGSHAGQSLSPRLHGLLFPLLKKKYGSHFEQIEYTITVCPTVESISLLLKSTEYLTGANVTTPYKGTIRQFLKKNSPTAEIADSVNTLLFHGKEIEGCSTDGIGFLRAVAREKKLQSFEGEIFLIGAGGAARAILHALVKQFTPKRIHIVNRSFLAAQTLVELLPPSLESFCLTFEKFLHTVAAFQAPRILINATPLGAKGTEDFLETGQLASALSLFTPQDYYIDITTHPGSSLLLQQAHDAGAQTLDGIGMLIEQAAASEWLWMTGSKNEEKVPQLLTDEEFYSTRKEFQHS